RRTVELDGAVRVAATVGDLGEQAEREVRTGADGARVARRPVAHLQAAAPELLGLHEAALVLGAERKLEDEVRVIREHGETRLDQLARPRGIAGDATDGGGTGDEHGGVADGLPALERLQRRPRTVEVDAGLLGVAELQVLGAEVERVERARIL